MNQIAKKQANTIKQHLESDAFKSVIAEVLPKHCNPERMARVAATALRRTPKLADCTQASFFDCMLQLSQWGLEPDGRHAHLIPYGNTCTLIIDYKGLVQLVLNAGDVAKIFAGILRTGDLFQYHNGEIVGHIPHWLRTDEDKPESEGEVLGAYCLVTQTNGNTRCEAMSFKEIEAIRKKSKAGRSGPWVDFWDEMAKKTVFRRMTKWITLSAEIRDIIDKDDENEFVADGVVVSSKRQSVDEVFGGDLVALDGPETPETPGKPAAKQSKPAAKSKPKTVEAEVVEPEPAEATEADGEEQSLFDYWRERIASRKRVGQLEADAMAIEQEFELTNLEVAALAELVEKQRAKIKE